MLHIWNCFLILNGNFGINSFLIIEFSPEAISEIIGESLNWETTGEQDVATSDNYEYRPLSSEGTAHVTHLSKLFGDVEEQDCLSEQEIEDIALGGLSKLGFDTNDEESFSIKVTTLMKHSIMRGGVELGPPEPVAYKVRVHRPIDGKKVSGKIATLSYFLDGTLQKMIVRWPKVDETCAVLSTDKTLEELVDMIYDKIIYHPLLQAESLYIRVRIGIKDGQYQKKLQIAGAVSENTDEGTEESFVSKVSLDVWI